MCGACDMPLTTPCIGLWHENGLKPVVIVNLAANQGSAERRWGIIKPELQCMLPEDTEYILYHPPYLLGESLKHHIREKGCNCVISAGGDGTINLILNLLMNLQGVETQKIHLGGIGLGSSNDFLKPYKTVVKDIPCRIRPDKSLPADIGKVRFSGSTGKEVTRYFIVNASLGVTAEANRIFNRGDQPIGLLKPRMVDLAILYTAVKTILTYRNIPVALRIESVVKGNIEEERVLLSNLAVLKNPHVSGRFVYDQDISMDDAQLGLNYCCGMSRWQLLNVLWDLSKGRFSGKPGRHSMKVRKVEVSPDAFIPLEMDGEVVEANDIRFSLAENRIYLLG